MQLKQDLLFSHVKVSLLARQALELDEFRLVRLRLGSSDSVVVWPIERLRIVGFEDVRVPLNETIHITVLPRFGLVVPLSERLLHVLELLDLLAGVGLLK